MPGPLLAEGAIGRDGNVVLLELQGYLVFPGLVCGY